MADIEGIARKLYNIIISLIQLQGLSMVDYLFL